ncbi:MAG TPA: ATP-binding protein [Chthoniobacterales bacterium]|nr:ATP-binding protein [Chthoniobacterales bacterium]
MKTNKSTNQAKPKASLKTDLEAQHAYVSNLEDQGEKGFQLIATSAFVEGMRDSGYKSTATAIDEFIDNSIQAQATRIDVAVRSDNPQGKQQDIGDIAVIDDGHGMEPAMIRAAVLWGGTHRRGDRSGFGRFGFGLPSAAVSITEHYEIYSKLEGRQWHRVAVDLRSIVSGQLTDRQGMVIAPKAEPTQLPEFVKAYLGQRSLDHGTVIVLAAPDRLSTGFRKPQNFHKHLAKHIGLVYRGLLNRTSMFVNNQRVVAVDPLFLDPNALFYDVGNGVIAEGREPLAFAVKTRDDNEGGVRVRMSYMPPNFQNGPDVKENERMPIMKANNALFIVTRAGRQIDLVTRPEFPKDDDNRIALQNYDRNWAIELDFDPLLDEEFGITVNKQQVSISDRMWEILANQGLPQIIKKDFKKRFRDAKDETKPDTESKSGSKESRQSTDIMHEAEKFETARPAVTEEKVKKAREKVVRDAEKIAKERNVPADQAAEESIAALQTQSHLLFFESLEGAPFYRVELYGPQKRIYINRRHRFFTDIYSGPESTPRLRTALELLLLVLGTCELDAAGDREIWYAHERKQWSDQLELRLQLLDRRDSVEDASTASDDILTQSAA